MIKMIKKKDFWRNYLKDNLGAFFYGYPNIFDSDLKKFFENIASQEKDNINYKVLITPSKKTFSFLQKNGHLYDFLTNLLENKSLF